ncbi:MAG: G1 family glutamic endopeptidase [Streptosporangiaceae bacterium]
MAAPASASTVSSRTGGRLQGPALALSIPVVKSKATAGYISEKRGIKSVSTTFEVPKITSCAAGQNAGMGPVVILVGNGYFVGAGAEAECQSGTSSYMVAINHNGAETHPLNVAARDKISVDITIGSKTVLVKIEDLTTKEKTSQSLPKGKVTAAELGDDSLTQGQHQVPIPKFTSHQFTDVKINGKVLREAGPLLDEELVRGKTVLIKAGPIDKAGDAFVMDFEHAT